MWERLWSIALYDLRLTEDHFASMTLRMFHALLDRCELEWERKELLNAIVASTVANYSMGVSRDHMADISDFMPSQQSGKKKAKHEAQKLRKKLRSATEQFRKIRR